MKKERLQQTMQKYKWSLRDYYEWLYDKKWITWKKWTFLEKFRLRAFIYTNNEKSEREIKESIPFTIATKRINYLGINLPKETNCQHPLDYGKSKSSEKHLLLLSWPCQSLWLCRSQQTVENSQRVGNIRQPDLPPEKSVCRSRKNI